MNKLLQLVVVFALSSAFVSGQLANGNFENWSVTTWEDLDSAQTGVVQYLFSQQTAITKTSDAQNGSSAIRLETHISGSDTAFGYFIFGSIEDEPEGGVPFTQKPTTFEGYYKSDIKAGDTALFIVSFWEDDTVRTNETFFLTGTQSTYSQFSFNLNIPSNVNPDSVTVAFASSNPWNPTIPKNGTWVQIDNLSFGGTGITQNVPNADFENWVTTAVDVPDNWGNLNTFTRALGMGEYVLKRSQAYKGQFAAEIRSVWNEEDTSLFGAITNGEFNFSINEFDGGEPYTTQVDTLEGYFKWDPVGGDTGIVIVALQKSGSFVGGGSRSFIAASTSSYTHFEVPFAAAVVPDTIVIYAAATMGNLGANAAGSKLTLDELQLKSNPVNTGISSKFKFQAASIFPNPASTFTRISFEAKHSGAYTVELYDLQGKSVYNRTYQLSSGKNNLLLDVNNVASGLYTYRVLLGNNLGATGKLTVE